MPFEYPSHFTSALAGTVGSRLMIHFKTAWIIVLITMLLVLAGEAVLYGSWVLTGSTRLDTLYGNSIHWPNWRTRNQAYPSKSEQLLKIATFGGSSAEGASSERSFADIIDFLSGGAEAKVYVRNYGRSGAPFHQDQAVMVRELMPYFDIVVIYAGNNEWVNPYYRNGGLPIFNVADPHDPEPKRRHIINEAVSEAAGHWQLLRFLRRHSRIYAIAWKIAEKLSALGPKTVADSRGGMMSPVEVRRARVSEQGKSLPDADILQFDELFAADLAAIGALAAELSKTVIVVGSRARRRGRPISQWCRNRSTMFHYNA
jgi:hypothetical protein